jgi:hypothetical protein
MILGICLLLASLASFITTAGMLRRVDLIDLLTGRYSVAAMVVVVALTALATVLLIGGLMVLAGIE